MNLIEQLMNESRNLNKTQKSKKRRVNESIEPVDSWISDKVDKNDGTYHAGFTFDVDDDNVIEDWVARYAKDKGFSYNIIDIDSNPDGSIVCKVSFKDKFETESKKSSKAEDWRSNTPLYKAVSRLYDKAWIVNHEEVDKILDKYKKPHDIDVDDYHGYFKAMSSTDLRKLYKDLKQVLEEDITSESKKRRKQVKEDFEYDETSEEDRGIYDWISTRIADDIFYKLDTEFNYSEEQDYMEAIMLLVKVYKSVRSRD